MPVSSTTDSPPVEPAALPGILTRREVARVLRVGLSTVDALTGSGELPSLLIGRRRLYRASDVEQFVAKKAS